MPFDPARPAWGEPFPGPSDTPLTGPVLQRYKDYARQRQMTLGDLLLENRIIFLEGVINDGTANLLVMKMLFLQYENRSQGIQFYINSPGGSVSSTLAIYDTMQFIECPIATYCIGLAASGAAVLLAGGAKGKRFALPNSKVMIHQPYGQVGGQISDIEIQAQEILHSRQVINEILAKHTGQPIERVAKDTERDRYLTAPQAKEYGIVDEVVGAIPSSVAKQSDSNPIGLSGPGFGGGLGGRGDSGPPAGPSTAPGA